MSMPRTDSTADRQPTGPMPPLNDALDRRSTRSGKQDIQTDVAGTPAKPGSFVLVVGHRPQVESAEGAAAMLRQLGSEVRTLDLWDDFADVVEQTRTGAGIRAMVF